MDSPSGRILVAGVGNRLMGDDGFGPRVVELLSELSLPENVELRDFGTAGVAIATELEGYDVLILIDSMEMEGSPGTIKRIDIDVHDLEAGASDLVRFTLHEVGVEGLLKFSKAIGVLPPRVMLVGCKPKQIAPGLDLSDVVERAAHEAVNLILDTLGIKNKKLKRIKSW